VLSKKEYTRVMEILEPMILNGSMPRCTICNGVIKKHEVDCYVCGEHVPGAKRSKAVLKRFWSKCFTRPTVSLKEAVVYRNYHIPPAS
jgi:hypothetical protein